MIEFELPPIQELKQRTSDCEVTLSEAKSVLETVGTHVGPYDLRFDVACLGSDLLSRMKQVGQVRRVLSTRVIPQLDSIHRNSEVMVANYGAVSRMREDIAAIEEDVKNGVFGPEILDEVKREAEQELVKLGLIPVAEPVKPEPKDLEKEKEGEEEVPKKKADISGEQDDLPEVVLPDPERLGSVDLGFLTKRKRDVAEVLREYTMKGELLPRNDWVEAVWGTDIDLESGIHRLGIQISYLRADMKPIDLTIKNVFPHGSRREGQYYMDFIEKDRIVGSVEPVEEISKKVAEKEKSELFSSQDIAILATTLHRNMGFLAENGVDSLVADDLLDTLKAYVTKEELRELCKLQPKRLNNLLNSYKEEALDKVVRLLSPDVYPKVLEYYSGNEGDDNIAFLLFDLNEINKKSPAQESEGGLIQALKNKPIKFKIVYDEETKEAIQLDYEDEPLGGTLGLNRGSRVDSITEKLSVLEQRRPSVRHDLQVIFEEMTIKNGGRNIQFPINGNNLTRLFAVKSDVLDLILEREDVRAADYIRNVPYFDAPAMAAVVYLGSGNNRRNFTTRMVEDLRGLTEEVYKEWLEEKRKREQSLEGNK